MSWGPILIGGFYPLYLAWRACAGSTIRHPLGWGLVAWASWCIALLPGGTAEGRYLALCLTACAGVAVLGARRPGVSAWHFVVAGLLATLLLPLLMGLGTLKLGPEQALFLAAVLLVGIGNYLPTRLFPSAGLLSAWCAVELLTLTGVVTHATGFEPLLLLAVPWLAWATSRLPATLSPVDRLWRRFRDRFGFLWAERMREPFNRAAENAGLGVTLERRGLAYASKADPAAGAKAQELLRALLRRFEATAKEQES